MSRHSRAIGLLLAGFAIGAIVVGGALAAHYETDGTEVTAIRITGGGLPDLDADAVYGVAELPSVIRDYHDSGRYDADLAKVDGSAERSLKKPAPTAP